LGSVGARRLLGPVLDLGCFDPVYHAIGLVTIAHGLGEREAGLDHDCHSHRETARTQPRRESAKMPPPTVNTDAAKQM
jgi:hypothetical protein